MIARYTLEDIADNIDASDLTVTPLPDGLSEDEQKCITRMRREDGQRQLDEWLRKHNKYTIEFDTDLGTVRFVAPDGSAVE